MAARNLWVSVTPTSCPLAVLYLPVVAKLDSCPPVKPLTQLLAESIAFLSCSGNIVLISID